ncbi:MAG: hypothetical protein ACI865_003304, partial [Flavobacteriaceae bacterium]
MTKFITAVICLISMTSFGQKESSNGMYLAPYISDKNHTITTNSYLKTSACSNTSVGDVGLIECAEVGTPAFGAAGVFTAVDSQGASAPSPAPPCD